MHRQFKARCIFAKSGIDTDDRERWEALLHMYAMMDQFVVRMGVAHIHAAHQGMLIKQLVYGTLCFGYRGAPIAGEFTKLGRPRCEIAIDDRTAEIVRLIFHWYVQERLDIIEIVRRLNADPSIPLPPKTTVGHWTRLAVRNVLQNTRYRGLWRYGVCESVFLPEPDYVLQRPRTIPLKEVQLEGLRIVEDAVWFAAAERLAHDKHGRGGRPAKDGNSPSRPKLLNGLLVCPFHDDQPLYVGGAYGRVMVCPRCRAMPAKDRPLFTMLNRETATELLIAQLVQLIASDADLNHQVVEECARAAAIAQRPDPTALKRAQQELAGCLRAIDLTRRTVGDTEEDVQHAERTIKELQGDAAGLRAEIARLEIAQLQVPRIPTAAEVQAIRDQMADRLRSAVSSNDVEIVAQARRILELVTGGRIAVEQQGPRLPQRGWLRGRYKCRLISMLAIECSGVPYVLSKDVEGVEIILDLRRPSTFDAKADKARSLKLSGLSRRQLMKELGCGKSLLTRLLKRAAELHGEPYIDGRSERGRS